MLLEVGRITRAHGVRGEVVVELVTDRVERTRPGAVFTVDGGSLTLVAARRHQHRWLFRFEGCDDRTAAERLAGLVLRAEPLHDPEELWVHELVGSEVVEQRTGISRGRCVAVQANPAHDLLVLESGALVPVVFVVSCADGVTVIDPPDGLFDDASEL